MIAVVRLLRRWLDCLSPPPPCAACQARAGAMLAWEDALANIEPVELINTALERLGQPSAASRRIAEDIRAARKLRLVRSREA